LKPLKAKSFQVQPARRGGAQRLPGLQESLTVLLSALGAAAGVKWTNGHDESGTPLAVAIIPGAQFDENNGSTKLDAVH
jgi:hypothetical protein